MYGKHFLVLFALLFERVDRSVVNELLVISGWIEVGLVMCHVEW